MGRLSGAPGDRQFFELAVFPTTIGSLSHNYLFILASVTKGIGCVFEGEYVGTIQ